MPQISREEGIKRYGPLGTTLSFGRKPKISEVKLGIDSIPKYKAELQKQQDKKQIPPNR